MLAGGASPFWLFPKIAGSAPSARYGHSASNISDSAILIFGGFDGSQYFSDLHIIETSPSASASWQWIRFDPLGQTPKSRAYHSAVTVTFGGKTKLIIFGGKSYNNKVLDDVNILDICKYLALFSESYSVVNNYLL